jgi:hypothetical protein
MEPASAHQRLGRRPRTVVGREPGKRLHLQFQALPRGGSVHAVEHPGREFVQGEPEALRLQVDEAPSGGPVGGVLAFCPFDSPGCGYGPAGACQRPFQPMYRSFKN